MSGHGWPDWLDLSCDPSGPRPRGEPAELARLRAERDRLLGRLGEAEAQARRRDRVIAGLAVVVALLLIAGRCG